VPIRNLTRRVQRLNKAGKFKHMWNNVNAFTFSLYTLSLPEGTEIPPGGRLSATSSSSNDLKIGLTRAFSFMQERLAVDDEDQGRVRFDAPPEILPPPPSGFERKLEAEKQLHEIPYVLAYPPPPGDESD
jgi:hypothetical protein